MQNKITLPSGDTIDVIALATALGQIASGNPLPTVGFGVDTNGIIQINPTISTSAYVADYCVGGIQTIGKAVRNVGGKALLDHVSVLDMANQKAQLSLLFFSANPTNGTYADHGAISLNTSDVPFLLGSVNLAAANYQQIVSSGAAIVTAGNLGIELTGDASGDVYVVALTTGTPTYSAKALYFNYGIRQA